MNLFMKNTTAPLFKPYIDISKSQLFLTQNMNIFNSQNQKKHHSSSKSKKNRLNKAQMKILEASFEATKKLDPEHKFHLARELGVPPRQIAIWYQNRRARWKNQSLEVDYNSLQTRLETALSEKKQLEEEIDSLRGELKRTQDLLLASQGFPPPVSSFSSYCDEGSSSLNDDRRCSWEIVDQSLQFQELYAYLMMGDKDQTVRDPTGLNDEDFWV
ncbi:homeobox-leucine zipper ATHB-52-like [Olea europaea subsp. europaea]|uniref:Homeobox-leucine zipper protein n=1 Tax=Olea europaea subsp. europaea TaxID=158383 RepID=A0A8S0TJ62_OLEEU|nr:homeobox-leucine zipper ATHB-52-like [Olea europaea subsp. europaea]